MLRYLVISVLLATGTDCLPNGAPTTVCDTMLPYHGGGISPQTSVSPFGVVAEFTELPQDTPLKVTIGSPQGIQFGGFMVHARDQDNRILGQFVNIPEKAKGINCRSQEDTLTHQSPENKGVMDLMWQPPDGFLGTVTFNATIAQAYDKFWVGLQSQRVRVVRSSDVTNTSPTSGGFTKGTSSTPPHFLPTDEPEKGTGKHPFYDNCFVEKGCFGAPAGCVQTRDCEAVVATTVKGERYEFELKSTKRAAYVAFGLSADNKMGDDSVIACVREGQKVKAYMSYTTAKPYADVRLPKLHVQLLNFSLADGEIYCKVVREVQTTVNNKQYNLVADKYYLLVASGTGVSDEGVGYHDIIKQAAGEPRYLSDVSEVAAAYRILVRLHGSFMLAAWVGTASIGILFARYYRQTWVGSQLCGKDQWFAWHRVFMICTWSLTMVAFVLIFLEIRGWSQERNPHAILGVCTTAICFFQPIGAYFRPHPGTPKRAIFNWLHWLAGNVAHILAIVTIFFAVKLNSAELPDWMDWILVAFVAFHVCIHLILSILGCVSDRSAERRVTSFPMKDLGANGRSPGHLDRKVDAPNSGMRKFILGVYMFIIILVVASLITIVVLAPIEETWKRLKQNMSEK